MKRTLSRLLSFILLPAILVGSFNADSFAVSDSCADCAVVADMDGNGTIGIDDAIHLLFHINFSDSYPLSGTAIADIDQNGVAETDDAIYLLFYVNFPDTYPLPSCPTGNHEYKPIAPPKPEHSDLYLPKYTQEQVIEYFEEVVLQVEYSDGTGNASLVQKWKEPLCYAIYGKPTAEDLEVLENLFEQLNRVEGFPGIYPVEEDGWANLELRFLDKKNFNLAFSQIIGGGNATGAVQYWYYTDTNDIYTANIGYRTDIKQSVRNSVLIEEVINGLGITDTVLREDSIVYQYSDDNTALSDMDWLILKLLYHPSMPFGADSATVRDRIAKLYY